MASAHAHTAAASASDSAPCTVITAAGYVSRKNRGSRGSKGPSSLRLSRGGGRGCNADAFRRAMTVKTRFQAAVPSEAMPTRAKTVSRDLRERTVGMEGLKVHDAAAEEDVGTGHGLATRRPRDEEGAERRQW